MKKHWTDTNVTLSKRLVYLRTLEENMIMFIQVEFNGNISTIDHLCSQGKL